MKQKTTNKLERKERDTIYSAVVLIETTSPMHIGSGLDQGEEQSEVLLDYNNLPFIPGPTLTGLIQDMLGHEFSHLLTYFGSSSEESKPMNSQEDEQSKEHPKGQKESGVKKQKIQAASYIQVNHGLVWGPGEQIFEEPTSEEHILSGDSNGYWHALLNNLPSRDFVRINARGVSDTRKKGKYSKQMVPVGTRFVFDITFYATPKQKNDWKNILASFYHTDFRIGAKAGINFGEFNVVRVKERIFHLRKQAEMVSWLNYRNSLVTKWNDLDHIERATTPTSKKSRWSVEVRSLKPVSHFLFSQEREKTAKDTAHRGFYKEWKFEWKDDNLEGIIDVFVIPGSSIRGLLSHRIAWHANLKEKIFFDQLILDAQIQTDNPIGSEHFVTKEEYLFSLSESWSSNHPTVRRIFGEAKDSDSGNRGLVRIPDIVFNAEQTTGQIYQHTAIDQFSSATKNTFLFYEETLDTTFDLHVKMSQELTTDERQLVTLVLDEIEQGLLPFGGMGTKGHGRMKGSRSKPTTSDYEK